MRRRVVYLAGLVLIAATAARVPRLAAQAPIVTIEGLDTAYPSCGVVKFSVRNPTPQSVYVNVYVDNREAGAWTHVPCDYDLTDPRSRTAKLSLSKRNLIVAGGSMTISYDRCTDYAYCMRPKYGRYDAPLARANLQQQDAAATSPVTQRIRVEAYRQERTVADAVIFSEPFTRTVNVSPPERRLLVWQAKDGRQGELTIFGSGVYIVSSERGRLSPRR